MEETTNLSNPSPKMNPAVPLALVALLLVGGGAVAYMAARKMPASSPTPSPAAMESMDDDSMNRMDGMNTMDGEMKMPAESGTMDAQTMEMPIDPDARVIEVEGGAFYYKPDELKIKKGETVTIKFVSKDMMHDLVVDELGLKVPITKGGETSTVSFTADKAGTFEYYCSVGEHRAQGQVGTLIVTE